MNIDSNFAYEITRNILLEKENKILELTIMYNQALKDAKEEKLVQYPVLKKKLEIIKDIREIVNKEYGANVYRHLANFKAKVNNILFSNMYKMKHLFYQ